MSSATSAPLPAAPAAAFPSPDRDVKMQALSSASMSSSPMKMKMKIKMQPDSETEMHSTASPGRCAGSAGASGSSSVPPSASGSFSASASAGGSGGSGGGGGGGVDPKQELDSRHAVPMMIDTTTGRGTNLRNDAKIITQTRLCRLKELSGRPEEELSNDQRNEKRRIIRLEKNRRAAAMSRRKKKMYIRNLEERAALMAKHLAILEMENHQLRGMIHQLTHAQMPMMPGVPGMPAMPGAGAHPPSIPGIDGDDENAAMAGIAGSGPDLGLNLDQAPYMSHTGSELGSLSPPKMVDTTATTSVSSQQAGAAFDSSGTSPMDAAQGQSAMSFMPNTPFGVPPLRMMGMMGMQGMQGMPPGMFPQMPGGQPPFLTQPPTLPPMTDVESGIPPPVPEEAPPDFPHSSNFAL